MTSSDVDSDVSEVPAIRIPTGRSVTPNSPLECDHNDNAAVTVTVTSFEENKARTSDQILQDSDPEDTDPEAMVRVRRPHSCQHAGVKKGQGRTLTPALDNLCPDEACRERGEGMLTPVADLLMSDPRDVTEAEIEAVPFDQHFYNQWARLPREEDPDSDVTVSVRRSASVRMTSATGSLKSYTLMNAIARDKNSPIETFAGLAHYMKTGSGDGGFHSPVRRGHSPADPHRSRPGGSRSANVPGRGAGDSLPPILRAKTALGTTRSEQASPQRSGAVQTSPRVERHSTPSSACLVTSGSREEDGGLSWPPGGSDRKLSVPRFLPRKDRSLASAGSHSKHLHRPPKSLSLNVASLLFSDDMDVKQGFRQQPIQNRPRTTTSKQRNPTRTEEDVSKNVGSNKNKDGGDTTSKPPEMTCVEFIDLAEVKKLLVRDGRTQGSKETSEQAAERTDLPPPARTDVVVTPTRQRTACSAAQRLYGSKALGKLYDGGNASASVGLPLTISAIVVPSVD